jgi:hypothetical protein
MDFNMLNCFFSFTILNFNLLQNSMPIKFSTLSKPKSAHGIGPCLWTRLKDSWIWKKIVLTKIASLKIWRTKLKSTFGEPMKFNLSNSILVYNVKTAMKGSFRKEEPNNTSTKVVNVRSNKSGPGRCEDRPR